MFKNFIDKYKTMSLPVKMSFWYLVCNFIQKGIGMISTPIFTRIMVDVEYGRYSVYLAWYSVISTLITLSISGNCFTRALIVTDDKSKREQLASSLMGLVVTLISTFAIIYFLFAEQINYWTGLNNYLFVMMLIDCTLITASQFWLNSKRVIYKYKSIVVLTLSYTFLRPFLAVLCVFYAPVNAQVEARVTGVAVANILLFSGLLIYIFAKGKFFYIKDNWKYALSFCIPLIPHYLSKTILNESDRIMIGNYCGTEYVGYYSIAYTIAAIMTIFNSSVAQSLDPWIYTSIKNRNLDKIGIVSYKIISFIAIINFFVMVIAPEVLSILAPSNYSQALWVIPPVTASVFFTFMYDLFASFQFYFKKTNLIAIGSCIGAFLNIILNIIFVPTFGFIAAGYTTLVCYILFGFFHYIFMKKTCMEYLDGYKVYNAKIIFGVGALLVFGSFLTTVLYSYTLIRYCILSIIIFILLLYKNKIIDIFSNIRSKNK